MEMLTKEIAQEIVDRAMKVISYNVNVMDRHGRIIASGDKSRINQKHEGAILALERRSSFDVTEDISKDLRGVMSGVNLLIEFMGEPVGVIGITGNTDEVRKYGEIVKMLAELFIEHSYFLKKAQWDKNVKEDFLLSLIHSNESGSSKIAAGASRLNFSLNKYHCVCLVDFNFIDMTDFKVDMEKIINFLSNRLMIKYTGIQNTFQTIFLLSDNCPNKLNEDCHEKCSRLLNMLTQNSYNNYNIIIGKTLFGEDGIRDSYSSVKDALKYANKNKIKHRIIEVDDLINKMIFLNIKPSWLVKHYTNIWSMLVKGDRGNELIETLNIYFKENCESKNAALKLNIHRNTLIYRFDKINELTGKDVKNKNDLLTLYVAKCLYENL